MSKEHKAGAKAADLYRKHGMSAAMFYTWKSKYGGMELSEAERRACSVLGCCRMTDDGSLPIGAL